MDSDKQLQPSMENKAIQAYQDKKLPSLAELPVLMSNCAVLTIEEAIGSNLPTLKHIEAEYGKEEASALVAVCLTEICIGLAFDINPAMIKITADLVEERWYDIKLSDLKLFKIQFLTGEIGAKPGKTYRLDTKVFLEAFDDFYKKRALVYSELAEERNRNPKDQYDTSKCIPMPDYVKESMAKFELKRILAFQEDTPKLSQKLTLDEIADGILIDKDVLANAIKSNALAKKALAKSKAPDHIWISGEVTIVTFEARKNPNYLNEYIINQP